MAYEILEIELVDRNLHRLMDRLETYLGRVDGLDGMALVYKDGHDVYRAEITHVSPTAKETTE